MSINLSNFYILLENKDNTKYYSIEDFTKQYHEIINNLNNNSLYLFRKPNFKHLIKNIYKTYEGLKIEFNIFRTYTFKGEKLIKIGENDFLFENRNKSYLNLNGHLNYIKSDFFTNNFNNSGDIIEIYEGYNSDYSNKIYYCDTLGIKYNSFTGKEKIIEGINFDSHFWNPKDFNLYFPKIYRDRLLLIYFLVLKIQNISSKDIKIKIFNILTGF